MSEEVVARRQEVHELRRENTTLLSTNATLAQSLRSFEQTVAQLRNENDNYRKNEKQHE
jgi:hypothetical protein